MLWQCSMTADCPQSSCRLVHQQHLEQQPLTWRHGYGSLSKDLKCLLLQLLVLFTQLHCSTAHCGMHQDKQSHVQLPNNYIIILPTLVFWSAGKYTDALFSLENDNFSCRAWHQTFNAPRWPKFWLHCT